MASPTKVTETVRRNRDAKLRVRRQKRLRRKETRERTQQQGR